MTCKSRPSANDTLGIYKLNDGVTMDPNSPAPAPTPTPTPEQPVPQTPQPTQQAPQLATNEQPQQTPTPGGQPPKKPNNKVVFAIVGGILLVVLLVVGIILAVSAMNTETSTSSNTDTTTSVNEDANKDDEVAKAEPIVAKQLIEMRTACVSGSVSNAGAYKKPYTYVIYENNNKTSHNKELQEKSLVQPYKEEYGWDMYALSTNDEALAQTLSTNSEPSELNVVVCLDRDDSTAVKTMTCELNRTAGMEDGASTVANFNSVKYKVTLYEAQSGNKITELTPVNGPATECPTNAFYTPESPDIYGDPDPTEIDAALKAFEEQ